MKNIHGTFNSFSELGETMGIKSKKTIKRKCVGCGRPMRQISGTNFWVCDFARIEDYTMKNGVKCQVFTRCGHTEIADS